MAYKTTEKCGICAYYRVYNLHVSDGKCSCRKNIKPGKVNFTHVKSSQPPCPHFIKSRFINAGRAIHTL